MTNLALSPERPAFNQNISFRASFNSTYGQDATFKWLVYIWRADIVTKSDNETPAQVTTFKPGTSDYTPMGSYRYGGTGRQCEFFFARVGWLDANNKIFYFNGTDGKTYEKGFQICDAATIPTLPPPPPATATVPPKPGPGLFVTSVRLAPVEKPKHNQDSSFFVTFSNTSDRVQTFRWKVYIWRADTPQKSDNETSVVQTGFPVGSGEYQAMGTYRYGPTGSQCDFFFLRVGWLDENNKILIFTDPDGKVYEKGFSICD